MNPDYLKSLRIVYFALAGGIAFFLVVALFVNTQIDGFIGNDFSAIDKTPFLVVMLLLTVITFLVHKAFVPRKISALKSLHSLQQKLAGWRELYILQGALIEAPSFLAIVLFLLLGLHLLLIWPLLGLILFWLTQPTREKLINEVHLSPGETDEFDKLGN